MIGYVVLILGSMTAIFYGEASYISNRQVLRVIGKRDWGIFIVSSVIGLCGLLKYISDFSSAFGGYDKFFLVLMTSTLDIRDAATETQSIGFHLSYFSWISIFFGVYFLLRLHVSFATRVLVIITVSSEILLNLTFVDRTRPIWIFIVCAMGILFSGHSRNLNIKQAVILVFGIPLVIFLLFALIVGKYDASEGVFDSLISYIVGGMGYLDSLLSDRAVSDYLPLRTFYPVSKILEAIGAIRSVPSQILEFRSVPIDTNVATFLEPLVSDGGILFVIIGVPVIAFLTNFISMRAIGSGRLFGQFVWANLIFSMLISFFVPKFNSVPIYLFCILLIPFGLKPIESKVTND